MPLLSSIHSLLSSKVSSLSPLSALAIMKQQQQTPATIRARALSRHAFPNAMFGRQWLWVIAAALTSFQQQAYNGVNIMMASALTPTATTTPTTKAKSSSKHMNRVNHGSITGITTATTNQMMQQQYQQQQQQRQQTRSFHTSSTRLMNAYKNDDDKQGGFLSKLKNTAKGAAKTVLPKKWFQSEEERQAEMERQRVKDQVSGGLQQVLKDAPLPVRMLGSMITPLISSAMSSMAETMEQQQASLSQVLSQATSYIINDSAVRQAYGDAVQVSNSPFSQSSSTTSINGQTSTRIDLAVAVQGSNGLSGVAQISANEQGVQRIVVQSNNGMTRPIQVSLVGGPRSGGGRFSGSGSSSGDDDNVIEAEIIDKKQDKW